MNINRLILFYPEKRKLSHIHNELKPNSARRNFQILMYLPQQKTKVTHSNIC